MGIPLSRRQFLNLSGAVVVSSAGCIFAEDPNVADFFLDNSRDQEVTVTTVVTRISDGEEIVNDTTTIPKEDHHEYEDPITDVATVRIHVSTAGGLENRLEWEFTDDEATGLWVTIAEDEIDIGPYAA